MFRISQLMRSLTPNAIIPTARKPKAPVVIWNLIRRCNLTCKHCYSTSADIDFKNELTTEQAIAVIDDLSTLGVPALILSGGEPLLRPDIFTLAHYAKSKGLYVGLSSNGTLINKQNINDIEQVGFDYVGISIDGMRQYHDEFRQMHGGFDAALNGLLCCQEKGIKTGLRFTLTQQNALDLPALLALMMEHKVEKFYLSHLNYSGRGRRNRDQDAMHQVTRQAMNLLFDTAWEDVVSGGNREFVTGNNDADGVLMLQWARRHVPDGIKVLQQRLEQWGGNASGKFIANIDNTGEVHPDTYWWHHSLGNVKHEPFSAIWRNTQDPLMLGLRSDQRPLKGRCALCRYLAICNGNTRLRAFTQSGGDPWAPDPGCYLTDEEIGLPPQSINKNIIASDIV